MTSLLRCFYFGLLAAISCPHVYSTPPANAGRRVIIVLPPALPQAIGEAVFIDLMTYVLAAAPVGEKIDFFDVASRRVVSAITIPAGDKQARANSPELAGKFGEIQDLLTGRSGRAGTFAAQPNLPESLPSIAQQHRQRGEPIVVLVIGTPLYRDPIEVFDFANGRVPTGGHLRAPDYSSIFSTLGRGNILSDVVVHWALVPTTWGQSGWQRREVERFWANWLQRQGGKLVSFVEVKTALGRLRDNVTAGPAYEAFADTDAVPAWRRVEYRQGVEHVLISKANNSQPVVLSEIPNVGAEKIGFAAIWEVNGTRAPHVDVDVYLSPGPGLAEVYYGNKLSPSKNNPIAVFYDDVMEARGLNARGDIQRVFEFVEVRHGNLDRVHVWLNLYRNDTLEAIDGRVRIQWRGRIAEVPFAFPRGLSANGAPVPPSERRGRAQWIDLGDLVRIFGRTGS